MALILVYFIGSLVVCSVPLVLTFWTRWRRERLINKFLIEENASTKNKLIELSQEVEIYERMITQIKSDMEKDNPKPQQTNTETGGNGNPNPDPTTPPPGA